LKSKIKKSSCFGNSIEFKNDELKKNNSNTNSSFENLKKEICEIIIQNKDKLCYGDYECSEMRIN
jgi:hypothetical protein